MSCGKILLIEFYVKHFSYTRIGAVASCFLPFALMQLRGVAACEECGVVCVVYLLYICLSDIYA